MTEENRRAYREMLFTTPGMAELISGVILLDETLASPGRRTPSRSYLAAKGIIPGIKVDPAPRPLAGAPARRSPKAWTACASGCRSTASSAPASPSGAR